MTYKTKLYAGFGTIIVLAAVLFFIVIQMLTEHNQNTNELINLQYMKIRHANEVRSNVSFIDKDVNELVFFNNQALDNQMITDIGIRDNRAVNELSILNQLLMLPKATELMKEIESYYFSYIANVDELMSLLGSGETQEALNKLLIEAEYQKSMLIDRLEALIQFQEGVMNESIEASEADYRQLLHILIVISVIALIIIVTFSIVVVRNLTGSMSRVRDVLRDLDYGSEQLPRLNISTNDEMGEIAAAFNGMAHKLEEQVRLERIHMEAIEDDRWLNSKVAELSVLCQGILDLNLLASQYINAIVPMVNAQYGVFYYKEVREDEARLVRLSTYAFNDDSVSGSPFLRLGQGLVGQCALENKPLFVEKVPKDYLKITSGLGMSDPVSIFIQPVSINGQVNAVLELATLSPLSELHRSMLNVAASYLGITLNRIEKHMLVEELLRESQTVNEELQTQSEELQQQREELKSMNDVLEAQNLISEQKTKDLEVIRMELEEKAYQVELGSKYKSEFLANMSHELRTPLNSLLILAKMLMDNQDNNLTDKQVEFARTIHSSGYELLQLINDILDLSKIESGKMDVHLGKVFLSDIVQYAEQQFGHVADQKGIEFVVKIDADLPLYIQTDELRLSQVLKNLLTNAFKFTEDGCVSLHLSQVNRQDEWGTHSEPMIQFAVSDTGIGIPHNKHQMIFEAFSQADGTTSRRYVGTGLGLSICRELAHLLGGHVSVTSAESKGSTFVLQLPFELNNANNGSVPIIQSFEETAASIETPPIDKDSSQQEETSTISTDGLEKVLSQKKILLVDDDMRNVFALTSALESEGIKVEFAVNGKEFLEKLQQSEDYDLVLMDIMMPEMNGYEAMRQIRQRPEYQSLPIIALTAKAMMEDRQKCIDAGASDYISKPVHLEQLFTLLRVWLYT